MIEVSSATRIGVSSATKIVVSSATNIEVNHVISDNQDLVSELKQPHCPTATPRSGLLAQQGDRALFLWQKKTACGGSCTAP
jgi:hypothetical protein